jgi:hypothetical protein
MKGGALGTGERCNGPKPLETLDRRFKFDGRGNSPPEVDSRRATYSGAAEHEECMLV